MGDETTIEEVREELKHLAECCWGSEWTLNNSPTKAFPVDFADIVEIAHISDDFPSHDSECYGILKLKDGRYLAFWEGCDYSGHG